MSPEVRLNNDEQAAESIDAAIAHLFDLLDHVARFHPGAIRPGLDLEIDQALSGIWIKHELPQVS